MLNVVIATIILYLKYEKNGKIIKFKCCYFKNVKIIKVIKEKLNNIKIKPLSYLFEIMY